jgi:hypothetical protein
MIRVGMRTIKDWHDYDPTGFGTCGPNIPPSTRPFARTLSRSSAALALSSATSMRVTTPRLTAARLRATRSRRGCAGKWAAA